ncbi:MAG: hypothetical protein RL716_680, partial [Actinomycetota bacterium]
MTINQYSLAEVISLAQNHRVIPVIRTLGKGSETPLSIFEKVTSNRSGSFLLESAEQGIWSRYSFIGVNNRGNLIKGDNGTVSWVSDSQESALPNANEPLASGALDAVAQIQKAWSSNSIENLPPLTSGLVGLMAWDLIREIENLGPAPAKDYPSPTLALAMFRDLVIVDHEQDEILLVSNLFVSDGIDIAQIYSEALARIETMLSDLNSSSTVTVGAFDFAANSEASHRVAKEDFIESITNSNHYVRIGDVFQVVLSQRLDHPCA